MLANWIVIGTILGILILVVFIGFRNRKRDKIPDSQIESDNPVQNNSTDRIAISSKKDLEDLIQSTLNKTSTKTEQKPNIKPDNVKFTTKVVVEEEDQSKVKFIGYNPINIFAQSEPLSFPYVIMPKPNCVIKFPRKGRIGRKGYKEDDFKTFIEKYFKSDFQIYDDRFILVKNITNPYEPDFSLIDERNGINLFMDIEIDEPYEGLNSIQDRRAMHYQNADTNRNLAFKNRGWLIIRFAEIQVHQRPEQCCRFIADVVKSIHPKYVLPTTLQEINRIESVKQWTKQEAEIWSQERYREKYLGIEEFGTTAIKDSSEKVSETEIGEEIEDQVKDEVISNSEIKKQSIGNSKLEIIHSGISSNQFLSFQYQGTRTIIKPLSTTSTTLTGFCYVKNINRSFNIFELSELVVKPNYCTIRVAGPTIGLEQITSAVHTAIQYQKYVRMKYTRSGWTNMYVDEETGELLLDSIEAEESIRTINDVQLSINALAEEHLTAYKLDSNYITAYCNKREEQRTFKFDRIGEIEVLDI
jgi:hypothetical protein